MSVSWWSKLNFVGLINHSKLDTKAFNRNPINLNKSHLNINFSLSWIQTGPSEARGFVHPVVGSSLQSQAPEEQQPLSQQPSAQSRQLRWVCVFGSLLLLSRHSEHPVVFLYRGGPLLSWVVLCCSRQRHKKKIESHLESARLRGKRDGAQREAEQRCERGSEVRDGGRCKRTVRFRRAGLVSRQSHSMQKKDVGP